MRTAATPASIAFRARLALKWMSAMTGIGLKRTIRARASASSFFGTAQRTISQPAETSAAICAVVASTSCVSQRHRLDDDRHRRRSGHSQLDLDVRGHARRYPGLVAQAADVVREADEEEKQDDCDPDRRDALVDLPRHRLAANPHDRERDVAAVERQQRQEVQEGQ
jgi:hypothetical protein